MKKDEFVQRFKAYMLKCAGGPDAKFNDGSSIAEYADAIAPTYWDDPDQRAEGPEGCAQSDMECWGN